MERLPPEILILIAEYLPRVALTRFALVCHSYHDIATPFIYKTWRPRSYVSTNERRIELAKREYLSFVGNSMHVREVLLPESISGMMNVFLAYRPPVSLEEEFEMGDDSEKYKLIEVCHIEATLGWLRLFENLTNIPNLPSIDLNNPGEFELVMDFCCSIPTLRKLTMEVQACTKEGRRSTTHINVDRLQVRVRRTKEARLKTFTLTIQDNFKNHPSLDQVEEFGDKMGDFFEELNRFDECLETVTMLKLDICVALQKHWARPEHVRTHLPSMPWLETVVLNEGNAATTLYFPLFDELTAKSIRAFVLDCYLLRCEILQPPRTLTALQNLELFSLRVHERLDPPGLLKFEEKHIPQAQNLCKLFPRLKEFVLPFDFIGVRDDEDPHARIRPFVFIYNVEHHPDGNVELSLADDSCDVEHAISNNTWNEAQGRCTYEYWRDLKRIDLDLAYYDNLDSDEFSFPAKKSM